MNPRAHRLWYFEAHLPDDTKEFVASDGSTATARQALDTAFAGVQDEAHAEANRRCDAYDASHGIAARAMSFSPVASLAAHILNEQR
jgi:hypothetical protein